MIRNGMWDIFSLKDTHNKENNWELFPHKSQFLLGYMKQHMKTPKGGYKADN